MSNSLSSFLVRSSSQAAVPFEGETSCSPLSAGAFLTGLTTSPHVSNSFLTATSQTSDSAFLTSQAGTSKTFLSLSESSETAETFLSSTEGDVSTAEEVLLSRNVGEYEEVAQGPMLYLVPATGLHVLVHHLPHSTQESTGPQLPGDDSSQEQFVVVGALQSEEEQVIMEGSLTEHPPGNTSHISVDTASLITNKLMNKTFARADTEYPRETERKPKKGSYSHRYSQGVQTAYPLQPGMLIGHRKSRTYNQEEIEENKSDNTENRKRRVRAPKNLQEQYWLHKQKPKPVFSKEVERTFNDRTVMSWTIVSQANASQLLVSLDIGVPIYWSMCQLHLWKAHGIDIDLFTCGICQTYKTCTQQRLVIHQKTHSDTRDHICKVCGKGFRQLAQLLNHQVLHITNAKNLPSWAQKGYCNECKRWFWDKKSLKIHISAVHLKLKPHACPHCSYRCSRKFDLKVHQRVFNFNRKSPLRTLDNCVAAV
nr:uncharacterized protein LOC128685741 [Cherax quadricarinatus]